ncbi:hypothetical protein A2U01_0084494, partial [Trifolium medium]|nr:hypothetical protein [Trifolium medium]
VLVRRARTEHVVGKGYVNCASRRKDGASRRKDGASRQQMERIAEEPLASARRAGEDHASRRQLGPMAR